MAITPSRPSSVLPTTDDPTGQGGLRDIVGNRLGCTGFTASQNFGQQFFVQVSSPTAPGTQTISDGTHTVQLVQDGSGTNQGGWTDLEDHNATATDSEGDYVVVWTTQINGFDRLMMQLYDANGDPRTTAMEVCYNPTPGGTSFLLGDNQRFGNVAMDADGDFVVTWTNFEATGASIYLRRFNANGTPWSSGPDNDPSVVSTGPFHVADCSTDQQEWGNATSDVAMDPHGDFIVTWSQDNDQVGTGWDVYAQRFDSFGQPIAPPFMVNVTTAGNQLQPAVAMDGQGGFVITWASNQNGRSDIFYSSYWPDGTVQLPSNLASGQGPLYGEQMVDDSASAGTSSGNLPGDRTDPAVAMELDGKMFTITWTGPDASGTGVYEKQFSRLATRSDTFTATYSSDYVAPGRPIYEGDYDVEPLASEPITDPGIIDSLEVSLSLTHPDVSKLTIYLVRSDTIWNGDPTVLPANAEKVLLIDQRPTTGTATSLQNVIFDDGATQNPISTALPPFTAGSYAARGQTGGARR